MAVNLAALKIFLETDAGFDDDVRNARNGIITTRLNVPDGGLSKRWRPISSNDFLDAIASEALTTTQEERIRTYTASNNTVPIHKANVRAWIQAQGFAPSTINALAALSEVTGKPGDQFLGDEDENVSLNDVRAVIKQVTKSPYTIL